MDTHFDNFSLGWMLLAGLLWLLSAMSFAMGRKQAAFGLMLLAAGAWFVVAATIDPYLHNWDERFHALVAKNMIAHPLQPMLYTEHTIPFLHNDWDRAYIWLHKQPLFLWQIALSFRLFGLNEFALRLPSLIMCVLGTGMIWRMGKLLWNDRVGFVAASLLISLFHLFELVDGYVETDQNDVAFWFYVSASIWAWVEYQHSSKRSWRWWIGLFAAAAVLCKWLVGLLVFGIWAFWLVLERPNWREWLHLPQALLISCLLFLPWQFYIFDRFPEDAAREMAYNSLHLFKAVEGHAGAQWFHVRNFPVLFGKAVALLFPLGLVIGMRRAQRGKVVAALMAGIVGTYLLFSFSATKMPSYPFIVASLVLLFAARAIDSTWTFVQKRIPIDVALRLSFVLLIAALMYLQIDIPELERRHSDLRPDHYYRQFELHNKAVALDIKASTEPNAVIFNVIGRQFIELMFYADRLAYPIVPDSATCAQLYQAGRPVYLLYNQKQEMPDSILRQPGVSVLPHCLLGKL